MIAIIIIIIVIFTKIKIETVLWRHPSPKTGEQHKSELEREAARGHGADGARQTGLWDSVGL